MKKSLFTVLVLLLIIPVSAQVPNQINYQGIARNSVGNVLPNQAVAIKLSVRDGSATGTVLYSETRNVTTNAFGLFYFGIGSPGANPVIGSLPSINWATGNKYLQVEIDPKGGSSFVDAGTTQLLTVPYAFYAAGAAPTGNAGGSLTGIYPNPTIANAAVTLAMMAPGVIPSTLPPSGPAGGSLTGNYPNPTVANGAIVQSMIAPGVTLPPNGPAGGSLSGNYPNPVIANGAVVQSMIAPGVTLPPSGAAGGDLSGNYPNPTVSRLQGRSVLNTAPATNDVLSFNGTNWGPVSLSSISNNVWTLNGTNIYNNNTGSVGIGTSTPTRKLHVAGGDALFTDSVIAKTIRVGSSGTTTGIIATSSLFGIDATGNNTGVWGKGNIGILGDGQNMGVWGNSTNQTGVRGSSTQEYGVYGTGVIGVRGGGSSYGVYGVAVGTGTGVYGESPAYGGMFYSSNGYGIRSETGRADKEWAGVFIGNVLAIGVYQTSDRQLKKDILDLENAMEIIKQLKPRSYEFLKDGKFSRLHLPKGRQYGMLAQELEEVLPQLVKEMEDPLTAPPKSSTLDNNGIESTARTEEIEKITIKAVNYTGLIPIMIKGMQEQQLLIDTQKEKIESLESRLKTLESMIATMAQKK